MNVLGIPVRSYTLGIILPVGISFYTFQAMGYTIDVYRGHVPACRNIVNFLAYVSFFPQLVAGPIERASHLIPQFERTLRITRPMLEEGLWLMLWGMFKKVVIADNLEPLVSMVYGNTTYSGPAVLMATTAFALQIYCDFSGYSDIARGTARVLGFDIMVNFNIPYAATSITEFWRRWHISLSTWLRDYLYISLGGNRRGRSRTYLNLLITMVLGGLWHGASWNFVLWGFWQGAGLMVHRAFGSGPNPGVAASAGELPKLDDKAGKLLETKVPVRHRVLAWIATMLFVLYGWLLFRAQGLKVDGMSALDQIMAMTRSLGDFSIPAWTANYLIHLATFAMPLVLMEIWQLKSQDLLVPLGLKRRTLALLEGALLLAIILFWEKNKVPFIYFQF
jgi:D-alanyl-lipoteichoic acid acyltransferase DltB (MBOAT superfamily)